MSLLLSNIGPYTCSFAVPAASLNSLAWSAAISQWRHKKSWKMIVVHRKYVLHSGFCWWHCQTTMNKYFYVVCFVILQWLLLRTVVPTINIQCGKSGAQFRVSSNIPKCVVYQVLIKFRHDPNLPVWCHFCCQISVLTLAPLQCLQHL